MYGANRNRSSNYRHRRTGMKSRWLIAGLVIFVIFMLYYVMPGQSEHKGNDVTRNSVELSNNVHAFLQSHIRTPVNDPDTNEAKEQRSDNQLQKVATRSHAPTESSDFDIILVVSSSTRASERLQNNPQTTGTFVTDQPKMLNSSNYEAMHNVSTGEALDSPAMGESDNATVKAPLPGAPENVSLTKPSPVLQLAPKMDAEHAALIIDRLKNGSINKLLERIAKVSQGEQMQTNVNFTQKVVDTIINSGIATNTSGLLVATNNSAPVKQSAFDDVLKHIETFAQKLNITLDANGER